MDSMLTRFRFFVAICVVLAGAIQTTTGARAQSGGSTPEQYIISVGDELELDILDDSEPPQRFIVGSDGAVQLPYIGGVKVSSIRVSDARELVRNTYIDREIFVDPGVELSIASFRPISVLGDVRTPGNYRYQPFMTAEQAVGLAGGPSVSANNEEARVLERRDLEGTLGELEFDLALAAARFARVRAQLADHTELSWSDLPIEIRPFVNRELFDEHKPGEDRIIAIEGRDRKTQRGLLEDAVLEAGKRVEFLSQREVLETQQIDTARAELERVQQLIERGIMPRSEEAQNELNLSDAEDDLLKVREVRSAAIVQAAGLKGELSQFDINRERDLRIEAQQFLNDINKLVETRASIQDRMRLLQQWMNAASGLDTELLVDYQVRRRTENGVQTKEASSFDELLPGDMLVIVVKPPEALRVAQ